jgi:hypothetical protein
MKAATFFFLALLGIPPQAPPVHRPPPQAPPAWPTPPKVTKPAAPQRFVYGVATSWRRPDADHTHTCAAKHTWDHTANPGHTCNCLVVGRDGKIHTCGLSQYIQDPVRKMVTITTLVKVPVLP